MVSVEIILHLIIQLSEWSTVGAPLSRLMRQTLIHIYPKLAEGLVSDDENPVTLNDRAEEWNHRVNAFA